jgi:glycosyltransferase 2 family protein
LTISETKTQGREWTRLLPGFLVSLVCLAIIAYLIEPAKLVEALKRADYRFVLAGVLITFFWLMVRTAAWRTLLQQRTKFWDTFFSLCEGYLMNNILPFRLGEIGRAYLLGRKAKLDFWQVLPTVIIERIIDLAIGVGLFLSTVPFVVGADWAIQAAVISGSVVALGLVMLFIAARFRTRLESWLRALGERIPFLGRLFGNRLTAFLDGLSILANPGLFLRSLAWMIFNWMLGLLQFYCYVRAFFPQGEVLWAGFSLGTLALGVSAPSTPGSLGVYELALVSALSVFVNNVSQSTALALTAHAIQYVVTGIPGGIGLIRDGESLTSLYRKARSIR